MELSPGPARGSIVGLEEQGARQGGQEDQLQEENIGVLNEDETSLKFSALPQIFDFEDEEEVKELVSFFKEVNEVI